MNLMLVLEKRDIEEEKERKEMEVEDEESKFDFSLGNKKLLSKKLT
jgi:hypothetical protein